MAILGTNICLIILNSLILGKLPKQHVGMAGCGITFGQKAWLDIHFRIHSGEKPCKCPWQGCEFRCGHPGNLVNHMLTHSGLKMTPEGWPSPGYKATHGQPSTLKGHVSKDELLNGKLLKCGVRSCLYTSPVAANFKSHMQIHIVKTGKKPFKCNVADCSYASAWAGNLKSHMQKHIGTQEPSGETQTVFQETKLDHMLARQNSLAVPQQTKTRSCNLCVDTSDVKELDGDILAIKIVSGFTPCSLPTVKGNDQFEILVNWAHFGEEDVTWLPAEFFKEPGFYFLSHVVADLLV